MSDVGVEDEIPDSHFTKSHWVRTTTETPVRIGSLRELVVVLIDHGTDINLMSKEVYQREK